MASSKRESSQETPSDISKKFGFTVPDLPEEDLQLPVGMSIDGQVIKTAKVRAMGGGDRKASTANKAKRSPAHMTTALLSRCVTDLGGRKPMIQDIRQMCEPDRNFLTMEIRRRTNRKSTMEVTAECEQPRGCGARFDFTVDLDQLDVRFVEPIWRENLPCFEFVDKELNINAVMHYILGKDSESLGLRFGDQPEKKINPVEMLNATISAMIVEVNGESVTEEEYDEFPATVQEAFEGAVVEQRAGPDLEVFAECEDCGRSMNPQVNIADFLLRGRQKKASKR